MTSHAVLHLCQIEIGFLIQFSMWISFDSVYGTETTEDDRPTLMNKSVEAEPANNNKKKEQKKETRTDPITNLIPDDPALQGEASVFTAQNARYTTTCTECEKPRLIYGKSKLTERQEVQLAILLSDFEYTCGSPVTPPSTPCMVNSLQE